MSVSARAFGARGDGSADDTAALRGPGVLAVTSYPHRYLLVCTPTGAAGARQLFAALGECSGDAPGESSGNVRSPLSADGSEPATHYRADFVVREATRQALEAVEAGGGIPAGLLYWRLDRSGVLHATNAGAGTVGAAWDWPDALASQGLSPVAADSP